MVFILWNNNHTRSGARWLSQRYPIIFIHSSLMRRGVAMKCPTIVDYMITSFAISTMPRNTTLTTSSNPLCMTSRLESRPKTPKPRPPHPELPRPPPPDSRPPWPKLLEKWPLVTEVAKADRSGGNRGGAEPVSDIEDWRRWLNTY